MVIKRKARTLAKAITTIRCVSYVARKPVKYATNVIRSKNTKSNHAKVRLARLICSNIRASL
ncbi:MAG: hypothetical protein WBE68_15885 [Candidatus Nitrosopolaris sp.]